MFWLFVVANAVWRKRTCCGNGKTCDVWGGRFGVVKFSCFFILTTNYLFNRQMVVVANGPRHAITQTIRKTIVPTNDPPGGGNFDFRGTQFLLARHVCDRGVLKGLNSNRVCVCAYCFFCLNVPDFCFPLVFAWFGDVKETLTMGKSVACRVNISMSWFALTRGNFLTRNDV